MGDLKQEAHRRHPVLARHWLDSIGNSIIVSKCPDEDKLAAVPSLPGIEHRVATLSDPTPRNQIECTCNIFALLRMKSVVCI